MLIDKEQNSFEKDIKTGSSDSILASLYRRILNELCLNVIKFDRVLERYVYSSDLNLNSLEATSMRGNLKKELMSNSIPWKVFIKGLLLLNVKQFAVELIIELEDETIEKYKQLIDLEPLKVKKQKTPNDINPDTHVSSLFLSIMNSLEVNPENNPEKFNTFLDEYMKRPSIRTGKTKESDLSNLRGNFRKELLKSTMTWKVFVKGLVFLKVKRFDLTAYLFHSNGMITKHSKTVELV